ncbi:RdRP-domain-containing protein [Mycena maculata]|uniref:RNA-dependent RNA polymerase n=1 Tax=Mycena maculata TaxID=230809 RepID=A0AAD7N7D9_9AGAR|nr:RdRP-domain-containing protein [Mycena maculata]
MQIFMRNIAFTAQEDDVKIALAQRLHRPPFSTTLPINFHVDIFRARGGTKHRGMGLLTVPTTEIGEGFLTIFGGGLDVKGRRMMFSRSTRAVNEGLVEMVRTTPWRDPEALRQERETRASMSASINLAKFSFGRFRRDGTFSEEVSYTGIVACNFESRRIEITRTRRTIHSSSPFSSSPPKTSPFQILLGMMSDLHFPESEPDTFTVWYPSNKIIHVAALSNPGALVHQVFLQSDLPPTFEHKTANFLDDREPVPERVASFEDADFRVTSHTSQHLRLVFETHRDLETFLDRCGTLRLPKPLSRDILVVERSVYDSAKLTALHQALSDLDFALAFEVEKAVWEGLLEPEEVVSMQETLMELQRPERTLEFETAAIFRHFLTNLSVPGLQSAPSPKRKRRNKKKPVVSSPVEDLRGKLAEAIQEYIRNLYQPRGRYTPAAAIYQAYHLVLTPSTQILEGPLPDQSNSVLRRFKDCHQYFLRVSFQDENGSPPRRDQKLSINSLLDSRYKKPLNSGINIAGRSYEFLGYSMSGLKQYSFIFVTPFWFEEVRMNADKIRERLGDFTKVLYKPALLGARWAQAFSASDPSVTLEPDQIQVADDKKSPEGSIFTDGCSSISVSLNRKVWKSLRASQRLPNPPSANQFRCGGAKGVLVQNPDLPKDTLVFRESQTKFEVLDSIRTLDITATSTRPILLYLNRPLICLLEFHGSSPDVLMSLQQNAIDEVQSIKNSLQQASKIFSQHGLGASFRLPSLFNNLYHQLKLELGPWSDPQVLCHQLIKTTLAYATTHILREIKHRAHIIVPGSYTLIGVSDEWDCLEEGEIYATIVDDRTEVNIAVTGRVLITRSPQIHPGDIQFVEAVRKPQLAHLRNVVVFACKGSRSLPSKLGGGDLDGDIYNLILDENLFPPKDFTAVAGEYPAIPAKETSSPCTVSDVADFVIDYIKSDLLGYISILHLRIADLDPEGPGCKDCMELAAHASHAVDFQKRGVPVDFTKLPRTPSNLRPDFLSGEGVNPDSSMGDYYYPSAKVLGKLYRSVPIDDYHPDASELEQQLTDGRKIQDALAAIGLRSLGLRPLTNETGEDLLEEMRNILDEYEDQLMIIAKTHTLSKRANAYLSEAELVSGTIQERYGDHRKRREAVSAMNLQASEIFSVRLAFLTHIQTGELAKAIRHEFRAPADREKNVEADEEDEDQDDYEEDNWDDMAEDEERRAAKFERAWAAWLVAEEALDDDPSAYGPSSFGLLALGTMLEVIKEARHGL